MGPQRRLNCPRADTSGGWAGGGIARQGTGPSARRAVGEDAAGVRAAAQIQEGVRETDWKRGDLRVVRTKAIIGAIIVLCEFRSECLEPQLIHVAFRERQPQVNSDSEVEREDVRGASPSVPHEGLCRIDWHPTMPCRPRRRCAGGH